jgi:hypothetical protein
LLFSLPQSQRAILRSGRADAAAFRQSMDKIFSGRCRTGCRFPVAGQERSAQNTSTRLRKVRAAENFINRSPIRSCAVATTLPAHFTLPIAAASKRFNSCDRRTIETPHARRPASTAKFPKRSVQPRMKALDVQ